MTFELYWQLKVYGFLFSIGVLIVTLVWMLIDDWRKKKNKK